MAETIEGFFLMVGSLIMGFVFFMIVQAMVCFWRNRVSKKYEFVLWIIIGALYFMLWPWVSELNDYTKEIKLPAVVRIPTATYMLILPLILLASVYDVIREVLGYGRTLDIADFCRDFFKSKST